ncbi:PAS domain-containing protein [Hydrogenophaga sp.]|uniref:hybrid sensor histidine kinase/response regulator n=1 Tax=Hydrogenophaga sp. TaxID=1904254 RepID=UPI0035B261AA
MHAHGAALTADFSSLFQFLPIGAYRSSREGMMLRANPALVQINGYQDESSMLEGVNRANSDWYVQPGRRAEFRALLERDGVVRGFVSEVTRQRDGAHLWVNENAHGVYGPTGDLEYYEGTVEDITDRVAAQKAQFEANAQLRLLAGQLPGMAFVVRVTDQGDTQYRFVSDGVRQIYGLTPDDVLRDPGVLARYRHPDDARHFLEHVHRIHAGEPDHGMEFRIVLPDGRIRWLFRRSDTVAEEPGAKVRVGILLDITARKEAELALRQSEALWKLALDSAGDGVWDWNMATGEEYVSSRIKAMYGYTEGELDNSPVELDKRTHPDDIPQMRADRQAHFEGRAPLYRNEHRIRCKDGSWKWVLSRGMVIERDEQGKPLRMVGTHTDISDLKQAEAQQRVLETQLRESQKMEAIGTLAGGVAHDFNNLLAAILGNLALAREDVGPDHIAQESLSEINRAAIRARQLVQQILAFSRRQAQELRHQPLRPLVEETLGLMRSLLPAGVQLVTQLDGDALPVLADATQVQQVLMNLCTNAWQAMGTRAGQITVALREVEVDASLALQLSRIEMGRYACLSVADNGPGMDAETQRRIFEPFFTTKAPGAGTGLGLSVVHGIVKSHQGAIAVHSAPGEGSRFDVYLPLASHVPVAVTAPVPAGPAPAPSTQGRLIVYVDDYEALSFLAGRLLRKQGYRVHTFVSGEQALGWMREHPEPVDLLVTDQNMPGLSGVELARAVRQLRPQQRVAIVSGHVNDQLLAAAADAGVADVLGKQDSMDALADAVRELIEGV